MIRLLVFCLCVGINSFAQRIQANFWNEAGIDYSISKRNYTSLSFSSRWDDYGCYKLFPEVSLGREILEGFKFELDYRFIKNREEFGLYSNSNRWNFNLKYGHKWNRIKINIRIRYQFGQAGSLNQNYDSDFDNAWRLKPQLSYKKKKSKFTYSAGLETFYNPQFGPVGKIKSFENSNSNYGLCEKNNFNNDLFVFIDMKIHSGKNRFYVWDFNSKKIIKSCLVSHGCGNNAWSNDFSKDSPTFSNVPDSHQSSLGKYKIGERGYSNWGVHTKYLLHGMESSNNKALQRNIVFHSWNAIADNEVFPSGTPEGWGCPAISNENFKFVDSLIQQSNKPTLMWIYNG